MQAMNDALGEKIRAARKAKGWSLLEVEDLSGGEFKASVLGAYERGERALSVARLCRLAELFDLNPSDLLPSGPEETSPIVLDLTVAEELDGEQAEVVDRFLAAIQVMRAGSSGANLAVRQSDLRLLAALLKAGSAADLLADLDE